MPWGCGVPRGALQIPGGNWEEARARGLAAHLSHPIGSAQRDLAAPATPSTAGDHRHPSCGGRGRIRHGSEPAAPSAPQHPAWALLAPPAPPGKRPGPEMGMWAQQPAGGDGLQTPNQVHSRGKPAILVFLPPHGCRVCSHGNSGACLHTKELYIYIGERMHACWGEDLQET